MASSTQYSPSGIKNPASQLISRPAPPPPSPPPVLSSSRLRRGRAVKIIIDQSQLNVVALLVNVKLFIDKQRYNLVDI